MCVISMDFMLRMFIFRNIYRCKSTVFRSPCYSFNIQRFQILSSSSRNLTPSHTTRDALMIKLFAFSRDVSLGHLSRN